MKLLIIMNSLDQISQQLVTETTDASIATEVAVDASALAIAAAYAVWIPASTDTLQPIITPTVLSKRSALFAASLSEIYLDWRNGQSFRWKF